MFRKTTTFVIGAGASCELNLPSGDGLKTQIMSLMEVTEGNAYGFVSQRMTDALKQRYGVNFLYDRELIARIRNAGNRIINGLRTAISIDNLLHSFRDDPDVVSLGKLAIAILIVDAEANSHLIRNLTPTSQLLMGRSSENVIDATSTVVLATWYLPLLQHLTSGIDRDNVGAAFENVRFVVFNYDRCVEQFLLLGISNHFDLPVEKVADILSGVEFIHPYGSLGPLPWQSHLGEKKLPFGGKGVADLTSVSSNLRTFTETVEDQTANRVKDAVGSAHTLIMLGFGFLEQNVELLRPAGNRYALWLLATAYGVSNEDQNAIQQILTRLGSESNPRISISPGTCRDLFDRNRIGLNSR